MRITPPMKLKYTHTKKKEQFKNGAVLQWKPIEKFGFDYGICENDFTIS